VSEAEFVATMAPKETGPVRKGAAAPGGAEQG
jgi:hypothetical protein